MLNFDKSDMLVKKKVDVFIKCTLGTKSKHLP